MARRPASSSDDGQWSEGLVSAARLVAAAAHALVEAANALVQGAASEERLISSARQVASSTAQLLVACKVNLYLFVLQKTKIVLFTEQKNYMNITTFIFYIHSKYILK